MTLLIAVTMPSWLIWGILPFSALIMYVVGNAALATRAHPEPRKRILAWIGTFGFRQLRMLKCRAGHLLRPVSINPALSCGLGSFVALTVFAKLTGTFKPIDEGREGEYCWR
ncbi:hypothetical protein KZX46_10510 [Polymorphobacter sp. PAMC 29334]|uniref:hypothetical protein n=1 Tax=Polymorphobacter sp. PAMC 29334 TaxID=2862331 RepID=UPI001C74CED9|nr:hypothetical protein [Polymorphobacter sp. PAMC 29334]QYE36315.1 hypothetical protein KZX46_10510 [Polymorphobacter sp. PAMC 29334]